MRFQIITRFALGMAILVGSSTAQESKPAEQAPQTAAGNPQLEPEASTQTAEQVPPFDNRKEKLSYAVGVSLAAGLKTQGIDVDADFVIRGLKDALSADQHLLMSGKDVAATLKTFQEERKQDIEHATKMLSEKNKRAGDAFFAENMKKPGVVTLPSGLQYKILKQGDGKKPSLAEKVVCNYRGTLLDGTEFDSSYKHNKPVTLPVKGLIKGWSEALQLMPVGSKWQLFIPPQIGYGERVVGGIGPNAMLIFEVELISIENGVGVHTPGVEESSHQGPVAGSGGLK